MTNEANYSIIPADGWFFIHPSGTADPVTVHRVAVWQQQPDGTVIGLIPVNAQVAVNSTQRLFEPPKCDGDYVHATALTEDELKRSGDGLRRYT